MLLVPDRRSGRRAFIACILTTALLAPATLPAQTPQPTRETLRVVVVEGGGAINNIAARTAREPVVRVLDASNDPVHGATVAFTAPNTGPGGTFGDGSAVYTAQTGPDGLAAGKGFKPNRTPGQFSIRVLASYNGETGRTTVLQTNASPASTGSQKKKIIIVAVVAGAAAGGLLASRGSKSASTPSSPAAAVVAPTPGSVTFIPPH